MTWELLSIIIILTIPNCIQAQELKEVRTSDILKQIKNGEDITLKNVHITGELNLDQMKIESKLTIRDSVFENDVHFRNIQFRRTNSASFGSKAYFSGASFGGFTAFTGASFSNAYFDGANFSNDAHFNIASFGSNANFKGANFRSNTDFRGASFGGLTYFNGANFSSNATFNGVNFGADTYFNNANFSGITSLFTSTKFFKVQFYDTKFITVNFYDADFNVMGVSWNTLKNTLVFDGATYIKLIKNFRELEQFDDADHAYYQYRQQSQINKSGASWLADEIWRIICGYGVKPGNTILFAILIILIFSLIYSLGGNVSIGNAFYFSLTTFASAQSKDWYPEDRYRKIVHRAGLFSPYS